jgi:hypothetical protein
MPHWPNEATHVAKKPVEEQIAALRDEIREHDRRY